MLWQTFSLILLLLFVGTTLSAEPTGIRHFRYISDCNTRCAMTSPALKVQQCCVAHNAGNWGTCTKLNQAICARKDVQWAADGNSLCAFYGFGFECMDRYQLGGGS